MPLAAVSAPLILAIVLALAALAKIRHPDSVLSSMRLLGLPAWLIRRPLARAFPWAELVLAAALLLAPSGWLFSVVAVANLLLFLLYWALIARGLTMTPRPACGCFGTIGQPIRPATLVRNTVLLLLAAVVLAMAVDGESSLSVAAELDGSAWWWLLAAGAAGATAALVVDSERPRRPSAHQPTPAAPSAVPAPAQDTPDDGLLDYERSPIPHQVLIDAEDGATSLRRLAATKAQLLIWVTCGCGRSHTVTEQASRWRESMPQIDVRLVTTLQPTQTAEVFAAYGERFLHDPDGTAFAALGFTGDPGAVLLGADGLLAGGPVSGLDDTLAFAAEVQAALDESA